MFKVLEGVRSAGLAVKGEPILHPKTRATTKLSEVHHFLAKLLFSRMTALFRAPPPMPPYTDLKKICKKKKGFPAGKALISQNRRN